MTAVSHAPARVSRSTQDSTQALVRSAPTNAAPTLFAVPQALRSVHGAIFSQVMYAAGGAMDWRLQRDGFVARDVGAQGAMVRLWDAPGQGHGPCVVFVHGLGGSSSEYRDTLVWLQSKCRRVISVDLPSHGSSDTMGNDGTRSSARRFEVIDKMQARINQALDAVVNEPVTLVGHSLGGYAAMRYALEGCHRNQVRALVVVSPDGAPWTARELQDDRVLFEVDTYAQANDIALRTYPRNPVRAAFLTPFIYARFATSQMQYLVHSDAKQPVLTPAQLGALPARTCLVFGRYERFDPEHDLTYFCAHMPRSTALRRPKAGHGAIVDADPTVLAAFEDFLV